MPITDIRTRGKYYCKNDRREVQISLANRLATSPTITTIIIVINNNILIRQRRRSVSRMTRERPAATSGEDSRRR